MRTACLLSLLAFAVVVAAGCSTAARAPAKVDDIRVKQFSDRGYLSDAQYRITTAYATWHDGNSDGSGGRAS